MVVGHVDGSLLHRSNPKANVTAKITKTYYIIAYNTKIDKPQLS